MKNLLDNKTAIVTGGAAGIGAKIVEKFAEEGAALIAIVDINEEAAKKYADEISEKFGCKCIAIRTSVDKEEDVKACFAKFMEHTDRLDVLVNCAGVGGIMPMDDITNERWERTFGINVKGTFFLSREALHIMKPQKYGRIINFSSQAGRQGGLVIGMDYSSSKGAILTLTKSLAKEAAAYNVTVNCVVPGLIATAMTQNFGYDPTTVPLGRVGTPEEVADVVVFAASDMSRYMTGASLDVNGGICMY